MTLTHNENFGLRSISLSIRKFRILILIDIFLAFVPPAKILNKKKINVMLIGLI
jgi:hypothetical protein